MTQQEANRLLTDIPYIYLEGGTRVDTRLFVSKMSSILSKLLEEYKPLRNKIPKDLVVLYLYNDKRVPTACVDGNNIFISVNYVYSVLKMNNDLIYVLLSNALLHIIHSLLDQERDFLSKGMPRDLWLSHLHAGDPVQLTLPLHHTLNIIAELYTNNDVLIYGKISSDVLKEQMNAVALNEHRGLCFGHYYHHHSELIDKWKIKVGKSFPLTPSSEQDPKTCYSGYMQTMGEIIRSLDRVEIDDIQQALL